MELDEQREASGRVADGGCPEQQLTQLLREFPEGLSREGAVLDSIAFVDLPTLPDAAGRTRTLAVALTELVTSPDRP